MTKRNVVATLLLLAALTAIAVVVLWLWPMEPDRPSETGAVEPGMAVERSAA